MNEDKHVELKRAMDVHREMVKYRDAQYINLIQQINTKTKAILTDDMGSQFIQNCGHDLAGEIIRNFFDTSDYYITVDQLATRILKFRYEDEYDPLAENGGVGAVRKSVYNYNELISRRLDGITENMDHCQAQLFEEDRAKDSLDMQGKKAYRESQRNENGDIYDELTGKRGSQTVVHKNGKDVYVSDLHADHVQAREAARYNKRYITEAGVQELREFWNSKDNMQIMHGSANTSKGDIRVCEIDGKIRYLNPKDADYDPGKDITHRATPEQLAEATVQQWEKGTPDSAKIQKLLEKGYLVKDDKGNIHVPKSVRKALEENIRHSQNKESVITFKNTQYGTVAKDAVGCTKASIGKIIAGQIIYYTAPPLIYELRMLLQDKKAKLDDVISRLRESASRFGNYVLSKIKTIFQNIAFNSLKKFVKSFMDILIGAVKATVKKLLKIAKNLVLSTVDAVRIIADKNTSAPEKADSVFNLFGVTITSCVVEILFELAANVLRIPEPFDDIIFGPLQILVTVVCTNLTMLILQKADLFDVRFGFKINAVKKVFEEERLAYDQKMERVERQSYAQIDEIIRQAKEQSMEIYNNLQEINPKEKSVRSQLECINSMFSMNIDYNAEWLRFLGIGNEKVLMPVVN